MMRRLFDKLIMQSGETLVETLAAIAVCTLAVIILAGAVVASSNINAQTKARNDALGAEEVAAADGSTSAGTGTVIFTIAGGSDLAEYPVTYYGGSDMVSY